MGFGEAISTVLGKYATFTGRAARSEFWYFFLFTVLVDIVCNVIDAVAFPRMEIEPISTIVGLALFLPSLAVTARRLHDIDRTLWWVLIAFTIIGLFVLLYWYCQPGTQGENRYGPDPLGGAPRQPV
jgi:uncharacterized membrane protein YhaH (DUF805 family)